jgi:hypothetical protein
MNAQPNLAVSMRIAGLDVYPDIANDDLYYYVPGPLKLTERNGRPLFDFLQTRFTGTTLTGNQGEVVFFSQIAMHIGLVRRTRSTLDAVQEHLKGSGGAVELRPLPLRRVEGRLVYAALGSSDEEHLGNVVLQDSSEEVVQSSVWTSRTFSVRLDEKTSMAFWNQLQEGNTILSFSYAYIAEGVAQLAEQLETGGSDSLAMALDVEEAAVTEQSRSVFADAFSIELDLDRDSDHFTRIDLNGDRVPPGYAAVTARCYDFRDQLRDDLWEKLLEVEAESVSGRPSRVFLSFSVDDPAYKRSIRFPFAVRLDQPYRYRVTEVDVDGSDRVGEWTEVESWVQPLDVTTPFAVLDSLRAEAAEIEEIEEID